MLAEFALNLCVFDEQANPDRDAWLEELIELGAQMFPRLASTPVLVSNLHGGSWHSHVQQIAESVTDHAARKRCQDILQKAKNALVVRPAILDGWPIDHASWAHEALATSDEEHIERIVTSAETKRKLDDPNPRIRSINEVVGGGFWHGIESTGLLPAKISDQVRALRKICVHSHFLCFFAPYIKGGGDQTDESDFARELIKSAFNRPKGFAIPVVEIHTTHDFPAEDQERLLKWASGIAGHLKHSLQNVQVVRLVLWPYGDDIDRRLIAGVLTTDSAGRQLRSPRWAISMTHVALMKEKPRHYYFSHMDRDSLDHWFNKYCRENIQGFSLAGTIDESGFKTNAT